MNHETLLCNCNAAIAILDAVVRGYLRVEPQPAEDRVLGLGDGWRVVWLLAFRRHRSRSVAHGAAITTEPSW